VKDEKYRNLVKSIANWKDPENRRDYARQHGALRRNYPELFVGGTVPIWLHYDWQKGLQRTWRLASDGTTEDAAFCVDEMKPTYVRKLRHLREDHSCEDHSHLHAKEKETAFLVMLDILEWLRDQVRFMRVCKNPTCDTRHTYFFRVYNNDKYCCNACIAEAKELRRDQREQENQTPPKEFIRDQESRDKMALSAARRWERERGKTGRSK